MKEHDYIPQIAKITARTPLRDDVMAFRLMPKSGKSLRFVPGQFVMLSVFGFGEVPVGITTSPDENGGFEVAVRSVGLVTEKICALQIGDEVGFSGPFGNGFPLAKIKGKDVVIVAGGIGLFPLRSLIHHLGLNKNLVKSLTILSGAKTPGELLYADEYPTWQKFASLHLAVDKGDAKWKGVVGQVTKLFDEAEVKKGSIMLVCGPPMMYKPVCLQYAGKRVAETDLYLLLERRMKCGIGKCQHCTCGKFYVCLDGPIFSYAQIKYNEEAFA